MATNVEPCIVVALFLALSFATGLIWGRLSTLLAVPESVKLASAPLLVSALVLVLGLTGGGVCLVLAPTLFHGLSPRSVTSGAILLALAAVPIGAFPSVVGWACGHRSPKRVHS
jgi:hypothetical protein